MENKTQTQTKERTFEVSEYIAYDKSLYWYLMVLAVVGLVVFLSVYIRDYRLAALVILGAIVFYHMAHTTPRKSRVAVSEEGITFRGRFYPWQGFRCFSQVGHGFNAAIHLDLISLANGTLVVPLPGNQKKQAKNNLRQEFVDLVKAKLPEQLRGPISLNDWLSRLIRF